MKKRKLIITLVSLFSLIAVVACKANDEPEFNEFEQAGEEEEVSYPTVELTAYEGENYIFDSTVSNIDGSVSYEIFVRSFYDTDSDGVGDFNGVREKLPYLKELGIKTVWLMPIMPSPSYHGYDVTDYYSVNPDYGTMTDFELLVEEAKNHNIDIMIDIVFNHSSTRNSWFIDSYNDYISGNTAEGSKADWYCWSEKSLNGYSEFSNSGKFYECRFDRSMPDFNTKNEAVRCEMINILKYWAMKGVAGFRFDAVKYFDYENTVYNVELLSFLHDEIVKEYPDIYFVGECWDSVSVINDYYKSTFESFFTFGSSLDSGGNATILGQAKALNAANDFGLMIEQRERIMKENNPNAYSSYFISNHDMDRASKSLVEKNAKMAASLYLLLPGTPFIYYGEEIQLKGVRETNDMSDSRRRLPMIWSMSDKVGECKFPEQSRPELSNNSQELRGVYDRLDENYSLLNHYKKVIEIRNKYPFIKNSIFKNHTFKVQGIYKNVLVYELSYEDESIIIVHNFGKVNAQIDLSLLNVESILDEVSVSKQNPELNGNILKIGKWSTVVLSKRN